MLLFGPPSAVDHRQKSPDRGRGFLCFNSGDVLLSHTGVAKPSSPTADPPPAPPSNDHRLSTIDQQDPLRKLTSPPHRKRPVPAALTPGSVWSVWKASRCCYCAHRPQEPQERLSPTTIWAPLVLGHRRLRDVAYYGDRISSGSKMRFAARVRRIVGGEVPRQKSHRTMFYFNHLGTSSMGIKWGTAVQHNICEPRVASMIGDHTRPLGSLPGKRATALREMLVLQLNVP